MSSIILPPNVTKVNLQVIDSWKQFLKCIVLIFSMKESTQLQILYVFQYHYQNSHSQNNPSKMTANLNQNVDFIYGIKLDIHMKDIFYYILNRLVWFSFFFSCFLLNRLVWFSVVCFLSLLLYCSQDFLRNRII